MSKSALDAYHDASRPPTIAPVSRPNGDVIGLLGMLGAGRMLEELAEALQTVSADVAELGQAGTVTLKLAIKPMKGGEMVSVEESITKAPPKRPARGAVLFAVDGGLYKRDPRQPELSFRAIAAEEPEVREIEYSQAAREV